LLFLQVQESTQVNDLFLDGRYSVWQLREKAEDETGDLCPVARSVWAEN
jgi:hypothetical protein